jgi:thioredoxin reductase
VRSTSGERRAASVVLALGRRGAPRKLGVPGEELDKVAYRVLEPSVFEGRHVLVVGGGNAAAESAIALADEGRCASVALSYRRAELIRLRQSVRDRVTDLMSTGQIRRLLPSEVVGITPATVTVRDPSGTTEELANDAVIVQIGGTSPRDLLASFGITMVEKRGEA